MSAAAHGRRPALLLVDLQEDFLQRDGLLPPRSALISSVTPLLDGIRRLGLPVLHSQTRIRPDGSDRMPHWECENRWECVEGTPGAAPPAVLAPVSGEPVSYKRFFNAFSADDLDVELRARNVDTLVIAGVYLHACIRETAIDAYARGYDVWIVDDAVASTEPVHAEFTREHLRRFVDFVDTARVLRRFGAKPDPQGGEIAPFPVACIEGRWVSGSDDDGSVHRMPADQREVIAAVPRAGDPEVARAAGAAARAGLQWRRTSTSERVQLLVRWRENLAQCRDELVSLLIREVGKPRRESEGEFERALAHIETAVALVGRSGPMALDAEGLVRVRHRPVGTIGLVTPWNNPLAIPVGKLAPALGFGNSVLWKPALQAPGTARVLMESLLACGIAPGLVSLLFGDASTARAVIRHPEVSAISITGSAGTGSSAAALCAHYGKRLQAELGGNNAAVVLADADLDAEVPGLALAAFGFAGQRCTAIRRFVVERSILSEFERRIVREVESLAVGDPADATTRVGPLSSLGHRRRVVAALEEAVAEGGRILCGGFVPAGLEQGCYLAPTVVADLDVGAHLVQEETFGPVAVLQAADDLDQAIEMANGVSQGLLAAVCTRDALRRRRVADSAEAGILKLAPGALAVHAGAPFGGWKGSGIGPPEHGEWDREFYTRPQAVYGPAVDEEPPA